MSNRYPRLNDSVDILVGTKLRPGIITNPTGINARVGHTGEAYTGLTRIAGTGSWTYGGAPPVTFKMLYEDGNTMLFEDSNTMRYE